MLKSRSRTVEYVEHDLACGIALGFFEHRWARVTLEAVTLYDRAYRVLHLKPNWLGREPLDLATREYLESKRAIGRICGAGEKGTWSPAVAARAREEAMTRAVAAKARAGAILRERDAWARAEQAGMQILD
jgi:hypothetical protein